MTGAEPEIFSSRIDRRVRLWWDRPRFGQRTYRDALHRLRERRVYRSRSDPDAAWRCCAFWQRTLLNKWNGREFATRHGCSVPTLYWSGSDPSKAPLESLPDEFVVRPVWGAARRGVLVVANGRDLLRDRPAAPLECARTPTLIEEFVRSEQGEYELPLEFKCHTFGGHVAAVEVIERNGVNGGKLRFYSAAWEPFEDRMNLDLPLADVRAAPRCLEQMLSQAATLGAELGTYMRIDFFATDRGCVFNEFSSTPGLGNGFTPYCNELFGSLWAARFPAAA